MTASSPEPGYLALFASGELRRRAERLTARLAACDLCPRLCGVDRRRQVGACGVGAAARLAVAIVHRGEEPPISGTRGAGALFVGGCNLRCSYCQNAQISQDPHHALAPAVSAAELAEAMLRLQAAGAHNIDWVSPTHVLPQLVAALELAAARGLRLPLVYNTNGYERVETLRELAGIVDLYLPDFKYWSARAGEKASGVPDYPARAAAAIAEMARQVGPLQCGSDGVARKGLIVRHLVLPGGVSGTPHVLRFVAEALPPGVAVSLMAQYEPLHRAADWPVLSRRLSTAEYERALAALDACGLDTGWVQDLAASPEHYRPDFRLDRPFHDPTVPPRVDRFAPPG